MPERYLEKDALDRQINKAWGQVIIRGLIIGSPLAGIIFCGLTSTQHHTSMLQVLEISLHIISGK